MDNIIQLLTIIIKYNLSQLATKKIKILFIFVYIYRILNIL